MADLLTDETWQQLDPHAGKLSGRDHRVFLLALVVAVLLLVAGGYVVRSGLVVPQVAHGSGSGYGYDEDTWVMYYAFELVNDGGFPVEVLSVGRDGPGLARAEMPPVERTVPGGRLGPGETMWVGVAYEVTDCAAVPAGHWPVPVRIARPWGTYTAWVELPSLDRASFGLPPAAGAAPHARQLAQTRWQRLLADAVCHYRAGGAPWDGG
jgi:hypothetical protein